MWQPTAAIRANIFYNLKEFMMIASRNQKATMILAIMAFAVVAAAQDPPPADPVPEDEVTKPVKRWWIDVGLTDWGGMTGNRHRLNQYATVPRGFVLRNFGMVSPSGARGSSIRVGLRGVADGDVAGEAELVFAGRVFARMQGIENRSNDPTPIPIEESRSRALRGSVTYAVTPSLSAFVQVDERRQNRYYEPPKEEILDRTRQTVAGVSGNLFGGDAALTYSNHRYLDRTGENPNSTRRSLSASFGVQVSSNFSLSGSYSRTDIEQNFFFDSRATRWGLEGLVDISDDASFSFYAKNETSLLPNSENNFVRKRIDAGATFRARQNSGTFQIGIRHKELERFRDGFEYVDVPSYDRVEAKWSSKLPGDLRYAVKGSWDHVNDPAQPVGGDERQLIFEERIRGQFKLDGGNEKFSGYGVYDFSYDQNGPRAVNIYGHTITLGGNWLLNEATSAYLEMFAETFSVSHGFEETGIRMDQYFPSGVSLAGGASWTLGPTSSLTLGASHFFSRNDNPLSLDGGNIRATQLTLHYLKQLSDDQRFEVTVAPWSYTDRLVSQMGYRATVFSVSFATKF
jgi:hypothetical protein